MLFEKMQRTGCFNSGKSSDCYCIPFVEGKRGSGSIAGSVRQSNHIKIPLQFSIFTWCAMNTDQYGIKMNGLSPNFDGKIMAVHLLFYLIIKVKPSGGSDSYLIIFKLFLINI